MIRLCGRRHTAAGGRLPGAGGRKHAIRPRAGL